jgi:PAS domain S-box-containing protein
MHQASIPAASVTDATREARLRRWIVTAGAIAIIANAGASGIDAWRSYRQTINDTRRELATLAQTLAEQAQGSLQTIDVLLRDTADWYSREGSDYAPGVIDAALASRATGLPQLMVVTISDARGIQQYRSRQPRPPGIGDITDRSYFTVHRDNRVTGLFVSEPIVTKTEKRNAIVLSRRLTDHAGRFAGVVAGIIELDDFQKFYRQVNLGTQSAIALLHDSATLVLREPPMPERVGKPFPTPAIVEQAAGDGASTLVAAPSGAERFTVGAHVRDFPLVVSVARSDAVVLDPWRDEARRVAFRTLVLSLLGALAIAALVRQLRRVELAGRALRESEEHYALAIEGANEGHFDWHLDGGPSFVSAKMKALYGLGPDKTFATREDLIASADVHPDDVPRIESALNAHFEGRTDRYELEYRVRHPDGVWHWLHVRGRCLRNAEGRPQRFVGSSIDVTARKTAEAEQERLELRLRKSQKMEAIGTLAGGIAHDFNNILGAILGYGELAQKSAAEGSVVRRYIDNVMHAGDRAKALVERILAFSRSGIGERAPINVQATIEETLELLVASLPARVQLRRRLEGGDAAVLGDATQLHQLAMNLCTNAIQAMPAGGVLEVSLDRADVRERRALSHGELAAGPYARLTVRDTGTGIKPDVLDRMFDPFFTTKSVGEGTGLGLSLVHGIVGDIGGAIDVASVPEHGTTFTIWMPVAGSAPRPDTADAGDLPRGNGEVVLIVDDEHALVSLAEERLAELGYEPVGFHSSTVALQAIRADPDRFDLVLTDEMMPELSGSDLAREILRLRPELPIVLMSGIADARFAERARSAGVREVLRKPLRMHDIAQCISRILATAKLRSGAL